MVVVIVVVVEMFVVVALVLIIENITAPTNQKADTTITAEIQYLKRREVRESNCERRAAGGADVIGCSV